MILGNHACVLLSGGQDSTTALAWAKERFTDVSALTVVYGQRHDREVGAARLVALEAGVADHTVVDVPLGTITKSDLFHGGGDIVENPDGLPSSFVPGRNLILGTLAAAYCHPRGIRHLVMGVSQVDFSGYPDCRRPTIDALQEAIGLGLDVPFTIHTPLVELSKADTVLLAARTPGAWSLLRHSWTCYYGGEAPCGTCPACRLRAQGFAEASMRDPALA